jgi:recombination protein RecA
MGNRTRVKVAKNKLASPFKETEFDLRYGEGISLASEVIDLGVEAGILDKSGSWISYKETRVGQGREAARQHLLEHPALLQEVRRLILEKHGVVGRPAAPEVVAEKPAARRPTAAAA